MIIAKNVVCDSAFRMRAFVAGKKRVARLIKYSMRPVLVSIYIADGIYCQASST
jgi:hypothetical protein